VSDGFDRLPQEMEIAIFRVVQECLTNIHRHSGSPTASVRLNRTDDAVDVEISDTGQGIASDRVRGDRIVSGVGLMGIEERMRQFGGSVKVTSSENGTLVNAGIPLKNSA
jgi:two-component system NarL family sensor kinase